jgi:hypothetical protein
MDVLQAGVGEFSVTDPDELRFHADREAAGDDGQGHARG